MKCDTFLFILSLSGYGSVAFYHNRLSQALWTCANRLCFERETGRLQLYASRLHPVSVWKQDWHPYIIHFQKHIHYSYPHILILLALLYHPPKYLFACYQSLRQFGSEEMFGDYGRSGPSRKNQISSVGRLEQFVVRNHHAAETSPFTSRLGVQIGGWLQQKEKRKQKRTMLHLCGWDVYHSAAEWASIWSF